jgi:imidazolonepropionase-like amidohydrolase
VRPELEITNVNVIDVTTGTIRFDAAIAIGNGRVCRIDASSQSTSSAVQRIDGRGRYALPGLWSTTDAATNPDRLVGYGITNATESSSAKSRDATDIYEHLFQRVGKGATPLEAIQSVTTNAATAARERRAGQLAPGFVADVILLEANPLADIANLRNVSLVILRGRPLGLVALARARAGRSEMPHAF